MRIVNRIAKGIGYFLIHFVTLIGCYIISLCFSASLICIAVAVMSVAFKEYANWIIQNFVWFYLVASIPFAVIFFIMVESDVTKELEEPEWMKQMLHKE